jgi:glycine/D-amino acid oxidase-like deaminating enzyme
MQAGASGSDWTVGVVGGGVVGCSAASFLAARGARVTVFDQTGVASGASGRNSGAVEHPYDPEQESLYVETIALLGELGMTIGDQPAGALLIVGGEREARELSTSFETFPRLGAEVLDPDAVSREEPLLRAGLWACRLLTGYPVTPRGATVAFADRARAHGASFDIGERVGLVRSGSQVTGVVCGGVARSFDTILIAAGAQSMELLGASRHDAPITALWGVNISIELDTKPNHVLLEGDVARVQAGGAPREQLFSLIGNPEYLALGSTFLSLEPAPSAWAGPVLKHASRFCPAVEGASVLDVHACARPRSIDGRPFIGRIPGQSRLWIAAGHGGRGISTGPATGRLIAEAMSGDHDDPIPVALRASRCAAVAGSFR